MSQNNPSIDWHTKIQDELEAWPVTCRVDEANQTVFVAFNSSLKLKGETLIAGYRIVQEQLNKSEAHHPFNAIRHVNSIRHISISPARATAPAASTQRAGRTLTAG